MIETQTFHGRRWVGRVSLIAFAGFAASGCQAPEQEATTVSFGRLLADEDVSALLGDDARVRAISAWSGGITASYQVREAQPVDVMLAEARRQLNDGFRRALDANTVRLRRFAAQRGQASLVTDAAARDELTSLLNLREALAAALDASHSGAPLVFGLEAEGARSISKAVGHRHQGPAMKPPAFETYDLQQRAPRRDLGALGRALAAFAAEPESPERGRPDKALRPQAPTPVTPAWWPQLGDLFYDGDRFMDSTMKWLTLDVPATDTTTGYEHTVMLETEFLEGCTTMTSLPENYAQCALSPWEHDPDYNAHRIGTRRLGLVIPGQMYWGMWSFSGRGPSPEASENRLTGSQTAPATGCATPPCFEATKRAWYIARGSWLLQSGQVELGAWAPGTVWELTDDVPDEE